MLKTRLIPCLDVKNGRVVKGVHFESMRDAGDPVEQAKFYDAAGADELALLDISASHEGRGTLLDLVQKVASNIYIPFLVGGGVRTVDDMRALLLAGADRVSINSAAVKNPSLVTQGAEKFGSQCITVAIDARRRTGTGGWDVYVTGGRDNTGMDVVRWAQQVTSLGAGEILLTSMDGDGTKQGYDLELTRAVADAVSVPVIASGGVGTLDHLAAGVTHGRAAAVLAASIFHDRLYTIAAAKKAMAAAGIAVRV